MLLIDQMPKKTFSASMCGDNCAKWILKIANRHAEDITINLEHIMNFDINGKGKPFQIRIANTGEIVHTMAELVPIAGRLIWEVRMP